MSDDDNIVHLPLNMPPALALEVAMLSAPANPDYAGFPPVDAVSHPAAAEWLRRKRDRLKQASRQNCIDWLTLVGAGLNGVTVDMINLRATAVWMMCCDFPDLVWCQDTMRLMWQHTPFLPTPGECHEVFTAYLAPILAEITALARIASAEPVARAVPAPPYELPPPPEWALKPPNSGIPPKPLLETFAAKHGRGPGMLGQDVLTALRDTAVKRAALEASKRTDDKPPDPPEAA